MTSTAFVAPFPVYSLIAPGDPSIAELLALVANGDQDAFGTLHTLTVSRVYGLVKSVLRDQSHAEEVTQEAYIEVWRHACRFDTSRGSAMSWILMTAKSKAIDRVRSNQASIARSQAYVARYFEREVDSTADTAITTAEHQELHGALDCLTDLQRQAVTLSFLGGLTYQEVSVHLRVPLGTVKARIRDGLIRLRQNITVTT